MSPTCRKNPNHRRHRRRPGCWTTNSRPDRDTAKCFFVIEVNGVGVETDDIAVVVRIQTDGQIDLAFVAGAGDSLGGHLGPDRRRQQQRRQNRDDGDDHQQFGQRERPPKVRGQSFNRQAAGCTK